MIKIGNINIDYIATLFLCALNDFSMLFHGPEKKLHKLNSLH